MLTAVLAAVALFQMEKSRKNPVSFVINIIIEVPVSMVSGRKPSLLHFFLDEA